MLLRRLFPGLVLALSVWATGCSSCCGHRTAASPCCPPGGGVPPPPVATRFGPPPVAVNGVGTVYSNPPGCTNCLPR